MCKTSNIQTELFRNDNDRPQEGHGFSLSYHLNCIDTARWFTNESLVRWKDQLYCLLNKTDGLTMVISRRWSVSIRPASSILIIVKMYTYEQDQCSSSKSFFHFFKLFFANFMFMQTTVVNWYFKCFGWRCKKYKAKCLL